MFMTCSPCGKNLDGVSNVVQIYVYVHQCGRVSTAHVMYGSVQCQFIEEICSAICSSVDADW